LQRQIIWNEEPGGNVEHVLANPDSEEISRSSGLPCAFGWTLDGRHIIVVYEAVDTETIYPVTAYEVS
jgi:hypothetical protein